VGGSAGSCGASGSGGSSGPDLGGRIGAEPGLKVAFLGDQSLGTSPRAVLELVRHEEADLLVILGDFDYEDDPNAWLGQLEGSLGEDFPWIAVGGNHDIAKWSQYQPIIESKLARIPGMTCVGVAGHQQSCSYRGVHFVLSRVGTSGSGHEDFIRDELGESNHVWKFCGWHKNQRGMQLGSKGDEVGWRAYQECQNAGAIITTGHEHSYGRTLTLSDLGNQETQHGASGDWDRVRVAPGETFVVVAGMGGVWIRDYHPALHSGDLWWATMYTIDWEMHRGVGESVSHGARDAGALFIEFGAEADPLRAKATFKLAVPWGEIVDEFEIITE
jgi:predicted phosphodiesterase